MTISRHPLRNVSDLSRVVLLADTMPATCRHIVDLPWRLSSLNLDEGLDGVFWQDNAGMMLGFAACQYPWATLDFFILPNFEAEIATDLFAWARQRLQERQWPYSFWVESRDDDQARQQLIAAQDFLPEEEALYIVLQHALANLPPVPSLPTGFTLRPLAGEREAAAYAELHRVAFASTTMNAEWRARTIHLPHYHPDLDIVITAADGSFAGFCVGWFDPTRSIAQIEPLGVHPHFQQQGLGRILLLEMLHRFKKHGAANAIVETNLDRTPARRAYESVGFQPAHTIRTARWPSP